MLLNPRCGLSSSFADRPSSIAPLPSPIAPAIRFSRSIKLELSSTITNCQLNRETIWLASSSSSTSKCSKPGGNSNQTAEIDQRNCERRAAVLVEDPSRVDDHEGREPSEWTACYQS